MSKRDIKLLLEDILESCHKIGVYTSDISFESFISDDKTIDAVIRNFEIIGEAANRIPTSFKDEYDQIQWNRLRGLETELYMNTLV